MVAKNILKEICDVKLQHIEKCKSDTSEADLLKLISAQEAPRGFVESIENRIKNAENALIAEVKKASPSKGLIREDFSAAYIAKSYENAGAACVSVLTDKPYFEGCDEYLKQVKDAISLPVLRKDFMLDEYQILESRAIGADCILLIMAALSDELAKKLETVAFDLGIDVLIEVHNSEELTRALKLKSKLLGINNRNLKTLEIDLSTTEVLSKMVTKNKIIVSESGIYTNEDILRMNKVGAKTFLVGESLMRQDDIESATKKLLGTI